MRIPCPLCGDRDIREFSYRGAAVDLQRPSPDASADDWNVFVHLRENPAGATQDLWYHEAGCAAWLVVDRNTVTHEITRARLARKFKAARS